MADTSMPEITVDELGEMAGAVVVDVREPDEYASGHVPAARNIPLGTVREHATELQGLGTVHVICQSGRRSAQATEVLRAEGVDAVNVAGGTAAWLAAGRNAER